MQSTTVTTGLVRFSYVNVFQPQSINGSEPKYSVSILIPKSDTQTINAINAAINAAVQADYQLLANQNGQVPPNIKIPLRDGDIERSDQPEYAGHYFINANSKHAPEVVDANVQPIINQGAFYSGCYGRASINLYAFNTNGNKGIAAGLNALQKTQEGEKLGGTGVSAAQAFGTPTGQAPTEGFGQQPPAQPTWGQQPPAQPTWGQQPPAQPTWGQGTPAQNPAPTAPPAQPTWGNQPTTGQQPPNNWNQPATNQQPTGQVAPPPAGHFNPLG